MKALSAEEDKACEVDDVAVLKVELDKGNFASALVELDGKIKSFGMFVSALHQIDLQEEPLSPYMMPQTIKTLEQTLETEWFTAIDRWKDVCEVACRQIRPAFPDDWKAKCVDGYEADFVKSKLLTQAVFDKLGTDYQSLAVWLRSLERCPETKALFNKRWKDELEEIQKVSADSISFAATILAYNVLIFKFPKAKGDTRRQAVKDVKKRIKTKLGKQAEIPQQVSDRLSAAISGK